MQCKGQNLTDRQANYDLLRIISTIAVIMIHVSSTYKNAYTSEDNPYLDHISTTIIYNTLSRFAVPCFMMLSGALLLSNKKNRDYKYFYRKSFVNIGIPTLIFSVLYFLYSIILAFAQITFKGEDITMFRSPIIGVITGAPFYHMWYLYTLIGVYISIPVIFRIKEEISEKSFAVFSWLYLLAAVASGFTSSFKLHWSISKAVCYIGFILARYQIKRLTKTKSNGKGCFCIIVAVLLLFMLSYIQYGHTVSLIAEADETYTIIGNFNPIIVISSLLIFMGFSLLNIKTQKMEKLSKDTFIIYLFHAAVWDIGYKIIFYLVLGTKSDPRYTIPLGIIIVFGISWFLCQIYKRFWAVINQNNKVSNKLCKILFKPCSIKIK